MGTETYPKGAKHSLPKLGEQHACTYADAHEHVPTEYYQMGSSRSYPAKGHMGPTSRHDSREQSRGPFITGSKGKLQSETYPDKTHAKFPSEGTRNRLKPPMSEPPKQA